MSIHNIIAGCGNILHGNSYTGVHDRAPYLFRPTGGNTDIGNAIAEYDTLIGASVAWNQLIQNGDFADGTTGWGAGTGATISANNGVLSVDGNTSTNILVSRASSYRPNCINGHKYLIRAYIKSNTGLCNIIPTGTANQGSFGFTDVSSDKFKEVVWDCGVDSNIKLFFQFKATTQGTAENVHGEVHDVNVIDLTLALQFAIAGRAYTLESGTAGSGIAWLKSYGFLTKPYYPYNEGALQSVKTSKHKTVGFNQWDEEWRVGGYNTSTGAYTTIWNDRICTKNYIPVIQNTTYFFKEGDGSATTGNIFYYDANKGFIYGESSKGNKVFTTPSNCCFINFTCGTVYGTTYNHDICINISDTFRNGEYEPYAAHEYDMPNTELRGLFKLDANNNIYADGDVCEAGGTVTRRYGIVDLGTLTWNYNSTYSFFYADISELKTVIGNDTIGNLICHKYVTVSLNTLMDASTGVICVRPTQNAIRIKDSNYTDKNTFTTAVSGLYLIYEKATPTTESSTPFQSPQICDNWGTEEYVDGRTVEIPVGHETEYYREA